ncbi:MAG: ATP-grasp domain-containing protein [Gammaproteobacteria bacterium]|nr:ATP-grasp domain-containing protein [Gammaproteobacteria bacterium]
MKPAIIISANTGSLAVVRALGTMGVPVVIMYYDDAHDFAHVSKYVVERIKVPHPEEAETAFIDRVVEYATHHGGGLLIPTADDSVSAVAKYKELLQQHYIVACPEERIAEQFIDKKHTYVLAERVGVPYPRTLVPTSVEEVERFGSEIDYPVLLKPSHSHLFHASFHHKLLLIENREALLFQYRRIAEAGLGIMIQELIPGNDTHGVNYNCYFWDGEPLVEFTSAKLRHAPPRFGYPCAVVSRHVPEVVEHGRALLRGMNYYGYANIEFKQDPRNGVYKLMEVNGRHNNSSLLAVRCGINFPWLQYQHLVEGELPRPQESRDGIYWLDPYRDISYWIKYYRQEQYTVSELIRPYFKPHIFATWDIKDPKPTSLRVTIMLKQTTISRGRKLLRLSRRLFRRSKKILLRTKA